MILSRNRVKASRKKNKKSRGLADGIPESPSPPRDTPFFCAEHGLNAVSSMYTKVNIFPPDGVLLRDWADFQAEKETKVNHFFCAAQFFLFVFHEIFDRRSVPKVILAQSAFRMIHIRFFFFFFYRVMTD